MGRLTGLAGEITVISWKRKANAKPSFWKTKKPSTPRSSADWPSLIEAKVCRETRSARVLPPIGRRGCGTAVECGVGKIE
jgi:hypothetical protein